MQTIEDNVQDCQRWEKAQKNLEEFRKKMDLIRQYPIKPIQCPPPPPQYTVPEDSYIY